MARRERKFSVKFYLCVVLGTLSKSKGLKRKKIWIRKKKGKRLAQGNVVKN
jgi:hypothetical protein